MNCDYHGLLNNCFILFLVAGAGFIQDPTISAWVWSRLAIHNHLGLHLKLL